jgi:tRNA (adenine22-N1)-methyltransferase
MLSGSVAAILLSVSESRNYRANSAACNGAAAASGGAELSPRLAAVADFVPGGRVVADIGSGHGLLADRLARRQPEAVARVIASDISPEEPVAQREANPRLSIDYRLGDGLDVIRPEDGVDLLIIAGMGARSILLILERGLPRLPAVNRLVLQPQTEAAELRAGLARLGWCRLRERLVRDRGRFYPVLSAERGASSEAPPAPLTEDDLLQAGADLLRRPTDSVAEYWTRQACRWERIVARRRSPEALSRLDQARRILTFLQSPPHSAPPLV